MKKILTTFTMALLVAGLVVPMSHAAEGEGLGVDVHGFVSQGFVKSSRDNNWPISDSGKGTFEFNEFGINFSKQLSPELRVGLQLFGQDRGAYGNDEITIDWAYGDYRLRDWFGVRAGKIKMPVGLYNETRDTDSLRTFVFLPQGIYQDELRETIIAMSGVSLYGTSPHTPLGSLAYQAQVGDIAIANDGGSAEVLKSKGFGTITEVDSDQTINCALEWRTPLEGLRLSGTLFHTDFTTTGTAAPAMGGIPLSAEFRGVNRYVVSSEFTSGDLVLAAEYFWANYSIHSTATTAGGPVLSENPQRQESYYLSATYRLNDLLELGSYYSIYHEDRHHPSVEGSYQKDAALALRIDPIKNLVFKVEGHYINGTGLIIAGDPAKADKDWYMFASKLTYNF